MPNNANSYFIENVSEFNFPAIAVRSIPTHDITAKYQHTKMLSNSSLVSQYGPTGDKMTLVNKLVTTPGKIRLQHKGS